MRRLLLQIAGSNANEAAKKKGRENVVKKKKKFISLRNPARRFSDLQPF